MSQKVVTRYAPSPTGNPHFGTAIYAILNWVYARQNGGTVIMRSEDTDPVRSRREFEEVIKSDLKWLGIEPDAFYRQSERLEIYQRYIKQLVDSGHAYVSHEEATGEGVAGMRDVIRLKNPNKVITFTDTTRGSISVDTTDLGDFAIARDMMSPLWHLTVVVDDFEMGVTHIIRGEDGLATTPRQILIQEAIGAPRPTYCHFPFVLNDKREKIGKRNGAIGIGEYRDRGYLPEAVVNFCVLLAWHPKDDTELFALTDLLKIFEIERVGKSGAIYDQAKLDWINKQYINKQSRVEQLAMIEQFLVSSKQLPQYSHARLERALPTIIDHIAKYGDVTELDERGELDYYFDEPTLTRELLMGKSGANESDIAKHLSHVVETLSSLTVGEWGSENAQALTEVIKSKLWDYATTEGRGKVLWPMRVALSGRERSPDPFTLAAILGKEESLERLQAALGILEG